MTDWGAIGVVAGEEDPSWRLRFRGGGLMSQSWLRFLIEGWGWMDGLSGVEESDDDMVGVLFTEQVARKVQSRCRRNISS